MASTLLNTVIRASVYAINSTLIDRNLYPYGQDMVFGAGSVLVQPNSFNSLQDLQAARTPGAALVYSRIQTLTSPSTNFYTNLTVAQIVTNLAT